MGAKNNDQGGYKLLRRSTVPLIVDEITFI